MLYQQKLNLQLWLTVFVWQLAASPTAEPSVPEYDCNESLYAEAHRTDLECKKNESLIGCFPASDGERRSCTAKCNLADPIKYGSHAYRACEVFCHGHLGKYCQIVQSTPVTKNEISPGLNLQTTPAQTGFPGWGIAVIVLAAVGVVVAVVVAVLFGGGILACNRNDDQKVEGDIELEEVAEGQANNEENEAIIHPPNAPPAAAAAVAPPAGADRGSSGETVIVERPSTPNGSSTEDDKGGANQQNPTAVTFPPLDVASQPSDAHLGSDRHRSGSSPGSPVSLPGVEGPESPFIPDPDVNAHQTISTVPLRSDGQAEPGDDTPLLDNDGHPTTNGSSQ